MLTEYVGRLIEGRFVTREEASVKWPDGIRLYYSNAVVDRYNARRLDYPDSVLCHPACHNITGYNSDQVHRDVLTKVAKMNASKMGGLPASICLSTASRMITVNVDLSDGLFNEKMGTLWYIELDEYGNLVRMWLELPLPMLGIVVPARTKDSLPHTRQYN